MTTSKKIAFNTQWLLGLQPYPDFGTLPPPHRGLLPANTQPSDSPHHHSSESGISADDKLVHCLAQLMIDYPDQFQLAVLRAFQHRLEVAMMGVLKKTAKNCLSQIMTQVGV